MTDPMTGLAFTTCIKKCTHNVDSACHEMRSQQVGHYTIINKSQQRNMREGNIFDLLADCICQIFPSYMDCIYTLVVVTEIWSPKQIGCKFCTHSYLVLTCVFPEVGNVSGYRFHVKWSPNHLTWRFLDMGGSWSKPTDPVGSEPRTLLLWGGRAKNWTTWHPSCQLKSTFFFLLTFNS